MSKYRGCQGSCDFKKTTVNHKQPKEKIDKIPTNLPIKNQDICSVLHLVSDNQGRGMADFLLGGKPEVAGFVLSEAPLEYCT